MNNSQFRNLLQPSASKQSHGSSTSPSTSQPFKTPMLGSRARSSIPMTPRSIAGAGHTDFRRQLSELDGQPPTKKFRSSAAPKGTRLASGYQDRTRLRDAKEGDDREKRLKALEEMLKLQQIDQGTFERLRGEIGVGGDVGSTHLVKGLDWKLLKRVREGEIVDVEERKGEDVVEEAEVEGRAEEDLDEELDGALGSEVKALKSEGLLVGEEVEEVAQTQPQAQVVSRDEILRRLKASRGGAQAQVSAESAAALGERFKKVGSGSKAEKKRFTELVNGRRREVLLTTDKDGRTKRKVRWLDTESTSDENQPVQQPLGMEVPAELAAKQKALAEQQQKLDDEDDDIFAGVGADYDPLADLGEDSDDEAGSDRDVKVAKTAQVNPETAAGKDAVNSAVSRNYFSTGTTADGEATDTSHPIAKDPTILAALKRAAALRQSEAKDGTSHGEADDEATDPEKALKRKQFLERLKQQDREDALDLDLGFGESRFGDEEDDAGPLWDGGDGEDGKKEKRKRAPKKRKGNKDNVADVMGVLEQRKK